MKRIQYHRYGGPGELRLEEVEVPAPKRDEVLVRIRAAAANPMDWGLREGGLKLMSASLLERSSCSESRRACRSSRPQR